jgi:hypothetical protein
MKSFSHEKAQKIQKKEIELTPKAFANFSPAVGAKRQLWEIEITTPNPERVCQ